MSRELVFAKLGGSLITDKARPRAARPGTIERLANEIGAAQEANPEVDLVIGHGSGSFGHPEAVAAGLESGLGPARDRHALSAVQRAARDLHSLVLRALDAARTAPFSLAPSSFLVSRAGTPESVFAEPLLEALDRRLLPVVFGDLVLDRRAGTAIVSTETVLTTLVERCLEEGRGVSGVLWLGDTAGVLDRDGERIDEIAPSSWARYRTRVGGAAAGHDVTGGMRHRVESALALAVRGVPSLIADGREPGLLEHFVADGKDRGTIPGTRVADHV